MRVRNTTLSTRTGIGIGKRFAAKHAQIRVRAELESSLVVCVPLCPRSRGGGHRLFTARHSSSEACTSLLSELHSRCCLLGVIAPLLSLRFRCHVFGDRSRSNSKTKQNGHNRERKEDSKGDDRDDRHDLYHAHEKKTPCISTAVAHVQPARRAFDSSPRVDVRLCRRMREQMNADAFSGGAPTIERSTCVCSAWHTQKRTAITFSANLVTCGGSVRPPQHSQEGTGKKIGVCSAASIPPSSLLSSFALFHRRLVLLLGIQHDHRAQPLDRGIAFAGSVRAGKDAIVGCAGRLWAPLAISSRTY